MLGRGFTPEEDQPAAGQVAVLGFPLWQSRYGGDPAVVGRTLTIDDVPVKAVGVMPRGFRLPTDFTADAADPTELWRPLQLDLNALQRGSHGYFAAATLAPRQTAATATAELHAPGMVEPLREGGSQASAGSARQRLRGLLVVAEIALAVVLVIGSGLMVRSLAALGRVDLGFNPDRLLTLRVSLPEPRYDSAAKVVDFHRQVNERVRALPGVQASGTVRALPLATTIGDWGLDVEGFVESPGRNAKGDWQIVSDGAFEAMGTRLVRGRWFTAADRADTGLVAVVNEILARAYWSDPSAVIGGRIRVGNPRTAPGIDTELFGAHVHDSSSAGCVPPTRAPRGTRCGRPCRSARGARRVHGLVGRPPGGPRPRLAARGRKGGIRQLLTESLVLALPGPRPATATR